MKRTRTRYGPDATLANLMEDWFCIKKYKGRNGVTDHWVCKRCPGDDPVHQSTCTSQGTRKRAHILGGKFAAIHRIRSCEGIDVEERKQLIALYNQCMRHSRKFEVLKCLDGDNPDGKYVPIRKQTKVYPINDDDGDKNLMVESRPIKKRRTDQQQVGDDGLERGDEDDPDVLKINGAWRDQARIKELTNDDIDDDDGTNCFYKAGAAECNFRQGMYQVPVVEVREPAVDFQNFHIMLGFYIYLIATQTSQKKDDDSSTQQKDDAS